MSTSADFTEARAAVEREWKLRRAQAERASDRDAIRQADEKRRTALANIEDHEKRLRASEEEQRRIRAAADREALEPSIVIGLTPRPIVLDHLGPRSRAALHEWDELLDRLAKTEADARKAEQVAAQRPEADAEAAARAVREGKDTPKPKAPAAVRKAEDVRAEAEALRRAARSAEADFLATLVDERDEIVSRATEEARLVHAEAVEVVRALALKLAALHEAAQAQEFAEKSTRGVLPGKVSAKYGDAMSAALTIEETLAALAIGEAEEDDAPADGSALAGFAS